MQWLKLKLLHRLPTPLLDPIFSTRTYYLSLDHSLPLRTFSRVWIYASSLQQVRNSARKPALVFGESRFVMSAAQKYETLSHFAWFWVLLAGNVEHTNVSRDSFLAAYDRCLVHPTPPRTKSVTQFPGLWLLARSCSCPQLKCKNVVQLGWGCRSSHFCVLEFRPISTNFDHCSKAQS